MEEYQAKSLFNKAINCSLWKSFDAKIYKEIIKKAKLGLGEARFSQSELTKWAYQNEKLKPYNFSFKDIVSHLNVISSKNDWHLFEQTFYVKMNDGFQYSLNRKREETRSIIHISWD